MTYRYHARSSAGCSQSGLTLLEVLVTLGIIAAVAGIGVQVYTGVDDRTSQQLVRAEMRQIASAIQRFRRDTGYWPKQGPFAEAVADDRDLPANLSQLFTAPRAEDGAEILRYQVATGTGWNGPYISELDGATVSVGDDLEPDGSGSPIAGTVARIRAIGDPFSAPPQGQFFEWHDVSGEELARLGRPYFYFIDGSALIDCIAPCLISAGPDGFFAPRLNENDESDDIVVNIGALN